MAMMNFQHGGLPIKRKEKKTACKTLRIRERVGNDHVKINYNCLDARTLCYKMTSAGKAATIKCIIWPFSDFKTYNPKCIKEPIDTFIKLHCNKHGPKAVSSLVTGNNKK